MGADFEEVEMPLGDLSGEVKEPSQPLYKVEEPSHPPYKVEDMSHLIPKVEDHTLPGYKEENPCQPWYQQAKVEPRYQQSNHHDSFRPDLSLELNHPRSFHQTHQYAHPSYRSHPAPHPSRPIQDHYRRQESHVPVSTPYLQVSAPYPPFPSQYSQNLQNSYSGQDQSSHKYPHAPAPAHPVRGYMPEEGGYSHQHSNPGASLYPNRTTNFFKDPSHNHSNSGARGFPTNHSTNSGASGYPPQHSSHAVASGYPPQHSSYTGARGYPSPHSRYSRARGYPPQNPVGEGHYPPQTCSSREASQTAGHYHPNLPASPAAPLGGRRRSGKRSSTGGEEGGEPLKRPRVIKPNPTHPSNSTRHTDPNTAPIPGPSSQIAEDIGSNGGPVVTFRGDILPRVGEPGFNNKGNYLLFKPIN